MHQGANGGSGFACVRAVQRRANPAALTVLHTATRLANTTGSHAPSSTRVSARAGAAPAPTPMPTRCAPACRRCARSLRRECMLRAATAAASATLAPWLPLPPPQTGACACGDACSYAHNVFEHWLHPDKYDETAAASSRHAAGMLLYACNCPLPARGTHTPLPSSSHAPLWLPPALAGTARPCARTGRAAAGGCASSHTACRSCACRPRPRRLGCPRLRRRRRWHCTHLPPAPPLAVAAPVGSTSGCWRGRQCQHRSAASRVRSCAAACTVRRSQCCCLTWAC